MRFRSTGGGGNEKPSQGCFEGNGPGEISDRRDGDGVISTVLLLLWELENFTFVSSL